MTNPVLSNEVENSQVIIWQYDHAPNLIGLIDGFNKIATDTVTAFWDYFRDSVFNIQTADAFGLNVLGRLMGLPRPTVEFADGSVSDSAPDVVPITDALFRRLLLGRFFLFGMSPTVPNYNKYLSIIWGRLSNDCFPITYDKGGEIISVPDCGNLAFIDRVEAQDNGDSYDSYSDSSEETVSEMRYLDVYDARYNTLLFTMEETDSLGEYAYFCAPTDIRETLRFNGAAPEIRAFPRTICKMKAFDGLDMAMSFVDPSCTSAGPGLPVHEVSPTLLTAEELAMHEQHPDLIYFYPAGIRTNAPSASSKMVIGFDGQNLENFADAFAWVENKTPTGGIFAGNEKAKYLDGVTEEGENNG